VVCGFTTSRSCFYFLTMAKEVSAVFIPTIPFEADSRTPKHKQLYHGYREAILSGQLKPGAQLPSTRELARHFAVSRNTVLSAFEQLLAEGFLEGKVGSGTFVSRQLEYSNTSTRKAQPEEPTCGSKRVSQISSALLAARRPPLPRGFGAFRVSNPAVDLFPWPTWSRLVATCSRQQTREQLGYSSSLGLLRCREAIAAYLRTSRNVRCEPEQVLIVSGSQQALTLAAKALLDEGDLAWVEDPGYTGARHAFLLNGVKIGPVPVDSEGLSVQSGRQLFPNASLAYITPSHQYPLGMSMSLQRRLELLEWARETGSWIIEDDYDSEYRYVSRPLSSLQGLSECNQVIYIGTFSKVLFPALRLGYIVVPSELVDRFVAVRDALDIFPPSLPQMVVAEFILEGHFARHIRRMRSVYAERLSALSECIGSELDGLAHVGKTAESGLQAVLYCSARTDDLSLSAEAARRNLIATPLSPYYMGRPAHTGLILGIGGVSVPEIRSGVAVLRDILLAHNQRSLDGSYSSAGPV
jgi:GntR family transcriptional regulator/MocR family aminotransferase